MERWKNELLSPTFVSGPLGYFSRYFRTFPHRELETCPPLPSTYNQEGKEGKYSDIGKKQKNKKTTIVNHNGLGKRGEYLKKTWQR